MVVIARKVGRLANRILLFAQFIGAAAEYGFSVANPSFGRYARYFPSTARDVWCRYPARESIRARPLGQEAIYAAARLVAEGLHLAQRRGYDVGLIRLGRDQHLDLDSRAFLSRLERHPTLFVQDWYFRSPDSCDKHRDAIRAFFTPFQSHESTSLALIDPARSRQRFVVGVHIRQGDYAYFKGGRYFYSHFQYRSLMEKVERAFPDQAVSFLLCSDAAIPTEIFKGHDVLHGNGDELEDLYALAHCDRLLGPPSTYSKWASYYGAVPRYEVFDPADELQPDSFRIDTSLSVKRLPETTDWDEAGTSAMMLRS